MKQEQIPATDSTQLSAVDAETIRQIQSISDLDESAFLDEWNASATNVAMKSALLMMVANDEQPNRESSTHAATAIAEPRQLPSPKSSMKRRWKIASVAAVVAALVVVGVNPFSDSDVSAVRNLPDGGITVDWRKDFRDADSVAAKLSTYGIDVTIERVPASPSAVGTIVSHSIHPTNQSVTHDNDDNNQLTLPTGLTVGADGSDTALVWTFDPATFTDRISIEVGITPNNGEAYVVSEEAFEPGEALAHLHCSLPSPLRTEALAPELDRLGLDVVWEQLHPDMSDEDTFRSTESTSTVPSGEVIAAYAMNEKSIRVLVKPDDVVSSHEFYTPRLSDFDCP